MPQHKSSIQLTELERLAITKKVAAHYAAQLKSAEKMDDLFSYVEGLMTKAFTMGKES